jgi:N-methylhydantoinase B/oxoprolinase/acetone carboxylase alpha subunit
MNVPLRSGDALEMRTTGGAGIGPPEDRAPDLVRRDVREKVVSRSAARRDYHLADKELNHKEPAGGHSQARRDASGPGR